jgi:S1-C subfamily serine protease
MALYGGKEESMELPEAIEHIRPAVVQIRVEPPQPGPTNGSLVIGTGFWVSDAGLLLTARHVIEAGNEALRQRSGSRLALGLAIPNLTGPPVTIRASFEITDAEVVEEDPRHDLALLRAPSNPFQNGRPSGVHQIGAGGWGVNALWGLSRLDTTTVKDGERIAVSGYPLSEPAMITTSGGIASAFGTEVQQVQPPSAPAGFTIPDAADSYLADVAVNPGNSGGPVYRVADGGVIGVCVAFRIASGQNPSPFFFNSGLSVIVPIKYGLDLIARHTAS